MPVNPSSKFADLLTYALAICLAAGCFAFASYKVIMLRGMDDPPPDLGLNFPPPKRKLITDDSILVDPLTTQSVQPVPRDAAPPSRALQPYTSEVPVESYKLLAVIDGVAFVEMKTFRGKDIVPLTAGSRLPGAGRVESIERRNGRWLLVAGDVRIVSERQ